MAVTRDTYQIKLDVKDAQTRLNQFKNTVDQTGDVFRQLRTAVAGVAIGAFVFDTIRGAKALNDFSRSSGIALQNLLGFTRAIQDSGANQDQAIDAIGSFSAKLREASNGSKEAQDAFLRVGISLDDLRTKTATQLLDRVFDGLAQNTDDLSRLGQQMSLFGESFRIVDTSSQGVASRIDQFTQSAANAAPSTQTAAEALQTFQNSLILLRDTVLITIQPLLKLFNVLLGSEGVVRSAVIAITSATVAFLAFTKVVIPLQNAIFGYLTVTKAATTATLGLSVVRRVNGFFDDFIATLKSLVLVWTTNISLVGKFQIALGLLIATLSRFAIVAAAVVAANEVLKATFDYSPLDSAADKLRELTYSLMPGLARSIDDLGEKFGLAAQGTVDGVNELNQGLSRTQDLAGEQDSVLRSIQDALAGETQALATTIKQYEMRNRLSNMQYQLETNLIGQSDTRIEKARELGRVQTEYLQERTRLEELLASKQESTSPSDQQQVSEIRAALSELDSLYNQQLKSVNDLTTARIREERSNRLSEFGVNNLSDATLRLKELQSEIASTTLPEIQRRYSELESQARLSAEAAIAAEEARRKSSLSEEERNQYLQAARQRIDELKESEKQLIEVQRQRRIVDFSFAQQIEAQRTLREINHQMATSILPERQRIEQDLVFQAKERARAEIAAETARRGSPLSAEEQREYYDAALQGIESISQASIESLEQSRSWSNGWATAFRDYVDNATNAARQAERIFTTMTRNMEDAIVNFAKTGKFEFQSFAAVVLEELLRIQIQRTFAGLASSSGGGAGSLFGGFFATGGMIPPGRFGVVGERGPELVEGPATVTPNIGGGTVTYNINAVDAQSFRQMVARDPEFLYAVTEQGRRRAPGTRR